MLQKLCLFECIIWLWMCILMLFQWLKVLRICVVFLGLVCCRLFSVWLENIMFQLNVLYGWLCFIMVMLCDGFCSFISRVKYRLVGLLLIQIIFMIMVLCLMWYYFSYEQFSCKVICLDVVFGFILNWVVLGLYLYVSFYLVQVLLEECQDFVVSG